MKHGRVGGQEREATIVVSDSCLCSAAKEAGKGCVAPSLSGRPLRQGRRPRPALAGEHLRPCWGCAFTGHNNFHEHLCPLLERAQLSKTARQGACGRVGAYEKATKSSCCAQAPALGSSSKRAGDDLYGRLQHAEEAPEAMKARRSETRGRSARRRQSALAIPCSDPYPSVEPH